MRRFFYEPAQEAAGYILIKGAEAHHIRTVLRLRLGEKAELLDGVGGVVYSRIDQINSDSVSFRILSRRQEPENCRPLTLVMALLKGKKMDMIVQKATELGVHRFVPVITHYCEAQSRDSQMLPRWQRIMLEACKQCGRPWLMQINEPASLHQLNIPAESLKVMPWEKETACSFSTLNIETETRQPALLLIGPEGGFHSEEVEYARGCGFKTVSLGPRILRAETAALTATVLIQHCLGSLSYMSEF